MPNPEPQSQELIRKELWRIFESLPSHDKSNPTKGFWERFVETAPISLEALIQKEADKKMLEIIGSDAECSEICEDVDICHHKPQNRLRQSLRAKVKQGGKK